VCAHIRKKEKRKERKRKSEKDPRQGKKDIMRDDQEKCKEGCDDVEIESSIFHTMCNPTSRTSLVP
jgi:hypothetical protein